MEVEVGRIYIRSLERLLGSSRAANVSKGQCQGLHP
jgi:hypothetical protein